MVVAAAVAGAIVVAATKAVETKVVKMANKVAVRFTPVSALHRAAHKVASNAGPERVVPLVRKAQARERVPEGAAVSHS